MTTDTPWPPEGTRVRVIKGWGDWILNGELVNSSKGWLVQVTDGMFFGPFQRHEIEVIDGER